MNILVTGATGFIGKHLANALSKKNTVIGLVHDRYAKPVEWWSIRGDITDYPRMLEIVIDCEIDQIYHCAAKSVVRNCRLDPLSCFQTNVIGTANVLEAARHSERITGVMCMESDKAYGSGPVPYVERQALVPGGVYEASKSCVSHLVSTYYANYDLPVFGVRSANVYGPDDPNMSRLIPNTITRLLNGQKPQVTEGANKFLREFIFIEDFVGCVIKLMKAAPHGQSINVGTGQTNTVVDVVELICEIINCSSDIETWLVPPTLTEIEKQWLDLTKLYSILGEYKPISLREGLKKTVEWYRQNWASEKLQKG